jgi:hypothetical protein
MSGLKRASKVGPLLENSARLLAEVSEQGVSQHGAQNPAAAAASQQFCLVQVGGFVLQQLGGLAKWSQNMLGSIYTASAAT